ncbi:Vitamin B12 import ATP-binding protein BtuD [Stutzerimonas stutzeri]
MTEALLSVRDLNAWYGESHALHGIDLDVQQGETVTLLGRNGVGKTTALRAIVGIIRKRSGSIRFDGKDMLHVPLHRTARHGIGYVPEERGIFATLTVNLTLPPVIAKGGMTLAKMPLFPNLEERRKSPGTKLSGGEQQMLAMARILRTGARLLLLDGQAEGLAPVVQRIGEVLQTLRAARHDHPAGGTELPLRQQGRRTLLRGRPRHGDRPLRRRRTARAHGDAQQHPGGLMTTIFDVPIQAFLGQLLIGLINGSFYAMLSLGLAIIFGMLKIINFAHGAQSMIGPSAGYLLLATLGIGYWPALITRTADRRPGQRADRAAGAVAAIQPRSPLRAALHFGLALALEGAFRYFYGSSGQPYAVPKELAGGYNLGFMFLPAKYRAWVVLASLVICIASWLLIEKTKLGAYLRAATENPTLVRTFGINVPLLLTFTYGMGAALAGLAGMLAAPIYQVSPLIGLDLIIVVFAVVVVGGMGSIISARSSPATCSASSRG